MTASEFTAMNSKELTQKIADLKSELFNLRFKLATGQLENTMQISQVKHDIARALTVQAQAGNKAAR
ncbi:MAG: 50S ribosomal protein L29 [Eubacteriales bacterium]|jgi:large subunit ribosomal protein L29|nr:50S ribosomal protein L29 [Eubacteriales bacterium]MDD4105411.1 50S ribosomal protein L29 [Eubacteriales bacterium]MDD4710167.1 50S ribosomal protein L29 [Eubacteriales bacterium]NLO15088.1 50S ribosomal protein L29 [Clostridiales bacterium]